MSSATHANPCVQYFHASRQRYGRQRLGFLTCTAVDACTPGLDGLCKSLQWSWLWERETPTRAIPPLNTPAWFHTQTNTTNLWRRASEASGRPAESPRCQRRGFPQRWACRAWFPETTSPALGPGTCTHEEQMFTLPPTQDKKHQFPTYL